MTIPLVIKKNQKAKMLDKITGLMYNKNMDSLLLNNYLIALPITLVVLAIIVGLLFIIKSAKNKGNVETKKADGEEPLQEEISTPVIEEGAIYDRSFTAKLIQSEDYAKVVYNTIKNKLLSYEKTYSHIGWDFDTFRFGRPTIAKFSFSGKTPVLYLALPREIVSKYPCVEDCFNITKYKSVPVAIKITTEKRLKIAIDLIEELANEFNFTLYEKETTNYLPDTKTMEEMLKEGLVKKVSNGSVSELIKLRKEIFNKDK